LFEGAPTKPVKRSQYTPPDVDLLTNRPNDRFENAIELEENIKKLEKFFADFKINALSQGATMGPTFTRYEMQMPPGISVSKVLSLDNDISMRLLASKKVRIEAPIPGKNAFGIEVPNKKRSIVGMRELVNDKEFYEGGEKNLIFTVGKDIAGKNYYGDLTEMPHLLIAGSTGSGKSCCLNALIVSFLYKYSPEDVKLILIDPKQVELSMYSGIPHLLLPEPVVDDDKVINALDWAIKEMNKRYSVMKEHGVNHINDYNKKVGESERFYRVVTIVDEVAELMTRMKREFEGRIKSITQLGRAAGIHVVLATQRPSVNIIEGVIKSNLPSRIAFAVMTHNDSQTILSRPGAEKLLGKGDMLFQTLNMPEPVRLQGVFIGNEEIKGIIDYIKANNESYFDAAIDEEINSSKETPQENANKNENESDMDPFFVKAVRLFIENGGASISLLQRKLRLGYARAARIVDTMEELNIVGKGDGAKPRSVLISEDEFYELYGDMLDDGE
jgi:S-DNA-T family DNA segregation ATPase FtsK/SpoIIIE